MKNIFVVPDSSFFICFLNDISKPRCLYRILNEKTFSFVLGEIIKTEIKKIPDNMMLEENFKKNNISCFDYYSYGEILRPFFSTDEIEKGEHEVIVITYILNFQGEWVIAILDDDSPKNFLKNKLPEISNNIIGTIGFVEKCTIEYNIFLKEESIYILKLIKQSKFWVSEQIIDVVIERIKAS